MSKVSKILRYDPGLRKYCDTSLAIGNDRGCETESEGEGIDLDDTSGGSSDDEGSESGSDDSVVEVKNDKRSKSTNSKVVDRGAALRDLVNGVGDSAAMIKVNQRLNALEDADKEDQASFVEVCKYLKDLQKRIQVMESMLVDKKTKKRKERSDKGLKKSKSSIDTMCDGSCGESAQHTVKECPKRMHNEFIGKLNL